MIARVLLGFVRLTWLEVVEFGRRWKVQTGAGRPIPAKR